jgi:hypothetical protein
LHSRPSGANSIRHSAGALIMPSSNTKKGANPLDFQGIAPITRHNPALQKIAYEFMPIIVAVLGFVFFAIFAAI